MPSALVRGGLRCQSLCANMLIGATLASCAATSAPVALPSNTASAISFDVDRKPLPVYRSRRLALSLPLPDGKTWRIDDHSQPELVATHAPTRSRIAAAVFVADALVGRTQCEDLARERKLVPVAASGSTPPNQTVEDSVAITEGSFDTRIVVALEPGNGPASAVRGHVMAFGGFLRKCYVFVYSTEIDRATDEPVLSERLAFVRARILGGLTLEPFDAIARAATVGPNLAPRP